MQQDQLKKLYSFYLKYPHVSTDTRNIKPNSIFFALKGDKFNANEFAEKAIDTGAAAAVIEEEKYRKNEKYFLVQNVLKTLQQLATYHRKQLDIPVIGITGSNGKTTTKELIAAVLRKKWTIYATQRNLNNHIGVPLTILSLTKKHQIAVIEMGANHIGEIAELCTIAQPNHGIITNIGKAHLEGFGSHQGVIKAKNELYEYIKKNNGLLFVNNDNELLSALSASIKRISYGENKTAEFNGHFLEADPFVILQQKEQTINTQIIGKYNFENILAAACIGDHFKVEHQKIKEALEEYVPSNSRSQVIKKGTNTILLDAYNANPTSMEAALNNFKEMKAKKKILILGDMLELGSHSLEEHKKIINMLAQKGFNDFLLIGEQFYSVSEKNKFRNTEEVKLYLAENPISNSLILIKGSRGIKLETLLELL